MLRASRVILTLLVLTAGCRSAAGWREIAPPYRAALEVQEYSRVEMLVADSTVVLEGPYLAGDTVKGRISQYYEKGIPIDHIQEMEGVPKTSAVDVFGGVLGAIGGAILGLVLIDEYLFPSN